MKCPTLFPVKSKKNICNLLSADLANKVKNYQESKKIHWHNLILSTWKIIHLSKQTISLKTYDFTVSPCKDGKGMVWDLCPVKSEHLLPLQLIIDRSPVESIVVPFIFASL